MRLFQKKRKLRVIHLSQAIKLPKIHISLKLGYTNLGISAVVFKNDSAGPDQTAPSGEVKSGPTLFNRLIFMTCMS